MPGERSSTQRMLRTMLTDGREDGPGIWRASLPLGKHTLGLRVLEVRPPGQASHVLLRAFPEDVISEHLTAHLFVRQRLAELGDIVATGQLRRDESGRLALDVQLAAEMPRGRLVAMIKRLTLDCARLRGAAEGLHAIAPEAAARRFDRLTDEAPSGAAERADSRGAARLHAGQSGESSRDDSATHGALRPEAEPPSPAPFVRPAPAPPPGERGRSGAARLRPPPSEPNAGATRMFAVPAELFAENPQVAAEARSEQEGDQPAEPALPAVIEGRLAMLSVTTGASSGERFPLNNQESFCIGRSPNVDITVNDRSVSRRNSLVRWIDDGLWIEDLNSANGTRVNGRLATRVELHPGDAIEVGETVLRVDILSASQAPEPADNPDIDLETSTVARGSGAVELPDLAFGALPPKIAARRGIAGQTGPVGPGMPTPPPRSGGFAGPGRIAPKAPAALEGPASGGAPAPLRAAAHGTGKASGVESRRRNRANTFFEIQVPDDGSGATDLPPVARGASPARKAEDPGSNKNMQRRKKQFDSFFQDAVADDEAPAARASKAGVDASLFKNDQVEDALDWMAESPAPTAAPEAASEAGGALDWMAGGEPAASPPATSDGAEALEAFEEGLRSGGADLFADAGKSPSARLPAADAAAAAAAAGSPDAAAVPPVDTGRIRTQREEALAWMDSIDVSESGTVDSRAIQRRHQFSIPKALLPSLRKIARDWYRHPERTTLSGEIRVEGESLWVQSGFAPGETSWRYRRPTLRLGRPPLHFGGGTYVPEPNELSHAEVASWLLSEGLIDEQEVTDRARARFLLEEAWVLRAEGSPDEALDRLEQVIELFDDDVMALTSIGHLCRKELEAPERGREYYIRALELAPRFTPALLGRAMLLLDTDRHRAAEAAVQALALAPEDPDALELAGLITLRAGRRARAREIFLRLFRKDRERGRHALGFIDAERGGTAKWDPRLVMVERRILESDDLDSITRALYEERIELAGQLDSFIEAYPSMDTADRARKLDRLRDARSYSFFADLLEYYLEEPAVEVKQAMEDAFLSSPTPAALALDDALSDGIVTDRAVAASAIAAKLQWRDLIPRVLLLFRRTSLPREIARLTPHLVRCSGAEVALALLAKLERGIERCRDSLAELLAERPAPAAEEAAAALAEVLNTEGAVELIEDDRVFLEAALEPAGSY